MTVPGTCSGQPLPDGWRWVRLGEVLLVLESGSRPKGGAVGVESGVRSISAEQMTINGNFDFAIKRYVPRDFYEQMTRGHLQHGDILIVKDGATTGKTCFVDETFPFREAVVNEHVFICRANQDRVQSLFLFYWLWGPQGQYEIRSSFQGAAIGGINQGFVDSVSISLPPLVEQRRIAAVLREQMVAVKQARAAAQARLTAVKTLPASILREAFSPARIEQCKLTTIDQIASVVIDGPHVTPSYVPQGIPFITVKNIHNGRLDFSVLSYITEEDHKQFCRRGRAERGDILYTKDGTLGIPCVVDTDEEFSFFVSVALIKLRREIAVPEFVAYAMKSRYVLHQVDRLGAGAGLKHMVLKSIRSLVIPCPSLEEQRRIAGVLREQMAAVEKARTAAEEELHTINALPSALLRRAFNGEL